MKKNDPATMPRPGVPLPHERDESAHPGESKVPPQRRARIERAAEDVERGLKDTDRRGTPNDVPAKK
jgi:hypothetical protein